MRVDELLLLPLHNRQSESVLANLSFLHQPLPRALEATSRPSLISPRVW